jgi:hypothetical protein
MMQQSVQGSEFRSLGLRLRHRPHMQGSALTLAIKAASQIEIEILKKRITNIEQGIINFEVRYSIIDIFE